jgi:hypothetical protein
VLGTADAAICGAVVAAPLFKTELAALVNTAVPLPANVVVIVTVPLFTNVEAALVSVSEGVLKNPLFVIDEAATDKTVAPVTLKRLPDPKLDEMV